MKVFFCTKCVNNSLRPRLKFDKRGVCDACQHNEKKKIINYKEREGEFKKLLSKDQKKDIMIVLFLLVAEKIVHMLHIN